MTLEIPAGKIDAGETAEECAMRELAEETGYKTSQLEFLMTYVPAIGYSSERLFIYKATQLQRIEDYTPHSDEISHLEYLTLDEIKAKIHSREIIDGKTIIAIACVVDYLS